MGQIEVILTEAVPNLGAPGDVRRVRAGYFRNYLGPKGKATYATRDALLVATSQKEELRARHQTALQQARSIAAKLRGINLTVNRPSREGQLYGSIRNRDVRKLLAEQGFEIGVDSLTRNSRIRRSGRYEITVDVYPTVQEKITVSVNPHEVPDINPVEWIMATPEEQFREIMREEVGDKITSLAQEVRNLTEATQAGFSNLREEMKKQTDEMRSEFEIESERAKMSQEMIIGSLNQLLEYHKLPTFNGPK